MTRISEPDGCGVRVRVCDEPSAPWEACERLEGSVLGPPFWAHAWPGGVALAQWVTAHPQLVHGKHVLDFASGGGVSALACLRSGAASVLATELDVWARAAIAENAALNELTLTITGDDVTARDDGWDVVLVGDVFYEREPSARIFEWLTRLHARGAKVLIGDPGRSFLPQRALTCVHVTAIAPVPAWDSVVDRPARVWELSS
ncbi:MAG: 50S ribosomal protein L11 methyltransferase [Archangium sp.]